MNQPETIETQHPHLAPWKLLPPKSGTCPTCATAHDEHMPHNQQSLFYQYDFYGKNGRWPTWGDAMAHCDPQLQEAWKIELRKKGIAI